MTSRAVDRRRPLEVTNDFRERLREALSPKGFVARAKGAKLLGRRGAVTHSIELGGSHRPKREQPEPRLFQYHVLHAPFALRR